MRLATQRAKHLADNIADPAVRVEFVQLLSRVVSLDDRMELDATRVEVRVTCAGTFLCRMAPYDELFHVQIGEEPSWETRVRTKSGAHEALDRVIQCYLDIIADSADGPAQGP